MAVIQVQIIDKYGTVLETKEIQDFQLETYTQAGYKVTTLEEAQIEITPEVLNLISQIESGELTVPQNFIDVEVINVKNGNITSDRVAQAVSEAKAEAEQKAQEQQSQIDELKTQIQNIGVIPTAEAIEQEQSSEVNYPMVKQMGVNFSLKNNRVTGRVVLNKITGNWNPYYNDRNLISYFQLKTINGVAVSSLEQTKQNIVKFPPSQPPLIPTQELTFDESAVDYKKLKVEIFLWNENNIAVAEPLIFELSEDSPDIDIIPTGATVQRNDFLSKGVGIFGGLLGISLLLTGLKSSNSRGK